MQGTQTDFKNELLYASFGINYSTLPARFRKVRLSCACITISAAQAWFMHLLMPALTVGLAGPGVCCRRVSLIF